MSREVGVRSEQPHLLKEKIQGEKGMPVDIVKEIVESGQIARLIPVVADSKKEERATSCLLATFMVVPSFAQEILREVGGPTAKRVKITCYTEVVFKSKGEKKPRPDGLIVVQSGSKTWTAIVESKIGNADLRQDQVETYLDLAKEMRVDAVITISNQFATLPTHHPVPVSKQKLRSVSLYHFSWLSLVSKAILLADSKDVRDIEDHEQGYILDELVRYLRHEASGVTLLTKMGAGWKEVCTDVQQGTTLLKNSSSVEGAVSSWQQLLRYLEIQLSVAISKPVALSLTRTNAKDPERNFASNIDNLIKDHCLRAEFDIPNAAGKLTVSADILRRTINFSMRVDAPKDISRPTASINWLTRQLKSADKLDHLVRVYWPKRIPMTSAPLEQLFEDPSLIVSNGTSEIPSALEVVFVVDLAGKFKGAKTFVEEISSALPRFYKNIGQSLSRWVPKAPKVKDPEVIKDIVPEVDIESSGQAVEGGKAHDEGKTSPVYTSSDLAPKV